MHHRTIYLNVNLFSGYFIGSNPDMPIYGIKSEVQRFLVHPKSLTVFGAGVALCPGWQIPHAANECGILRASIVRPWSR